jgi:hypothetical protein
MSDSCRNTDGVTFIVRLNAKDAFRKHVTKEMPWQHAVVDLSSYAGKRVDVELVTDPGPAGDVTYDHAVWGEPRVLAVKASERSTARIELAKPAAGMLTGSEPGPSTLRIEAPGSGTAPAELTMPCTVFLYNKAPLQVTLPFDLTKAGFAANLLTAGAFMPGSVWAGGSIEQVTVNGVSETAINGHPPSQGRTVLTWLLQLPREPAKLAFTAGIKPEAATEGVGFVVRVNGVSKWAEIQRAPGWWPGEVDLTTCAGHVIVLELVTDSLAEPYYDWATWVQPKIVAAP